jgi:hypothetical protein
LGDSDHLPKEIPISRYRATAAAAALLGSLALAGTASAGTVTQTFDQHGEYPFVVPDGISAVQVHAIGQQGGAGLRSDHSLVAGGWGGDVSGTVAVVSGDTYWVQVAWGASPVGFGAYPGGPGGGASSFSVCSLAESECKAYGISYRSRLIVAGGGGGAAGGHPNKFGRGGNAGAPGTASERAPRGPLPATAGGAPGTETATGAGGKGLFATGTGGGPTVGGFPGGGENAYAGGGGGGAGWFGGGGGGASGYDIPIGGGGGGGGSNHADRGVRAAVIKTATTSEAKVELTWSDDVAPALSIDDLTVSAQPMLSGTAGTAIGDRSIVDVDVYAGSSATDAEPVQQHTVKKDGDRWSVQLSRLAPGTYTAVATQRDWANNAGSQARTFHVDGPTRTPSPAPQPTPGATPTPVPQV